MSCTKGQSTDRDQAMILGNCWVTIEKTAARLDIAAARPWLKPLMYQPFCTTRNRHKCTTSEPHSQHFSVWPWAAVLAGFSSVANHTKIFYYRPYFFNSPLCTTKRRRYLCVPNQIFALSAVNVTACPMQCGRAIQTLQRCTNTCLL
jgi:hypothetical protein